MFNCEKPHFQLNPKKKNKNKYKKTLKISSVKNLRHFLKKIAKLRKKLTKITLKFVKNFENQFKYYYNLFLLI